LRIGIHIIETAALQSKYRKKFKRGQQEEGKTGLRGGGQQGTGLIVFNKKAPFGALCGF
jgi:hypothetical protein